VILLVADTENSVSLAQIIAQETPYHVYHASNSFAARSFMRYIQPHLVILDCRDSAVKNFQLYHHLHANRERIFLPAIVIGPSLEDYQDDIKNGKLVVFPDPFDLDDLISTIEDLLVWPFHSK
jgi:DNA-binding NtrC family response regulator